MPTVIKGSDASFTVTVSKDGEPVFVDGAVTAQFFNMQGEELLTSRALSEGTVEDDWLSGVVGVSLSAADTALLPAGDALLVLSGNFGLRRFRVLVEDLFPATRDSIFVRDLAVAEVRQDQLMAAAAGSIPDVSVTDDYLWGKIRAAESEIAHTLRVPLVPTRFFPEQPDQSQIDALGGMAWDIDPGYDYERNMLFNERWAYFLTRQTPVISVESLVFSYPVQHGGYFEVPIEWVKVDPDYGHIRIVPTNPALYLSASSFIMMALTGARTIPHMIELTYTAGLKDALREYPELVDIVKKKAVLKILQDSFLPQSGSISADGLSESISVDADKYQETIDHALNGPPGSNGGLMAKIHGVRVFF